MAMGPGQNYTPWNNVAGAQGDTSGIAMAGNLFGRAMGNLQGMVDRKVQHETDGLKLQLSQAGSREELNKIMGENAGNLWANMGEVAETGEKRGNRLWDENMQTEQFDFNKESELFRRDMQIKQFNAAQANAAAARAQTAANNAAKAERQAMLDQRYADEQAWERQKHQDNMDYKYASMDSKLAGGSGGGSGGSSSNDNAPMDLTKMDMSNTQFSALASTASDATNRAIGNSAHPTAAGTPSVRNVQELFGGAITYDGNYSQERSDQAFYEQVVVPRIVPALAESGLLAKDENGQIYSRDPKVSNAIIHQAKANLWDPKVKQVAAQQVKLNTYDTRKPSNLGTVSHELFGKAKANKDPYLNEDKFWSSPKDPADFKRDTAAWTKVFNSPELVSEDSAKYIFANASIAVEQGINITDALTDATKAEIIRHHPRFQDPNLVDDPKLNRMIKQVVTNPHDRAKQRALQLYLDPSSS